MRNRYNASVISFPGTMKFATNVELGVRDPLVLIETTTLIAFICQPTHQDMPSSASRIHNGSTVDQPASVTCIAAGAGDLT